MSNLANECTLSFYEELTPLNNTNTFFLVKNIQTDKLFVKKHLSAFHLDVYQQLTQISVINLPHIYEVIAKDNECIIIEEYIHGETLSQKISAKALSPQTAVELMLSLCQALKILHTCEPPIIHRDIKPDNIMISNDGVLKLMDFNIARTYTSNQTKDTEYMGTAGFAAPEQFGFQQTDVRTDIYSCGVLYNYLLTQNMPTDIMAPSPYAAIIRKCISLDPKDRYQSIFELEQTLLTLQYNITASTKTREPQISDCQTHLSNSSLHSNKIPETIPQEANISLLPPGFRTKKPLHIAAAIMGYPFILWLSFSCEFKDVINVFELYYLRVVTLVACLGLVATLTNYMDIQRFFPKCKHPNKILRFICTILFACLVFCGVITIAIVFSTIVKSVLSL